MIRGWPRTLSWNDFTPITNPGPRQLVALNGHPIVARVNLTIMMNPGLSPRRPDGKRFNSVEIQLIAQSLQYVPTRVPASQAAYYLQHEQGHMDLMGLFARELEINLLGLEAVSAADLTIRAQRAVNEAVANAQMYAINVPNRDCIYDRETNHGMNRQQQQLWTARISRNKQRWQAPDFIFRTD